MNQLFAATALSQVLPVAAGVASRRRLTVGRKWIVAWGVYSTLGVLTQWFATRYGSNLWLSYILTPIDGSLTLIALSCWQQRPEFRRLLRWAVPVALAVHIVLVIALENRRAFSIATTPLYGVLGLGAALLTLVGRSLNATEPLHRQDWFWIAGGLAIYYAAYAVITPIANALARTDLPTLRLVYAAFAAVNVVAYGLVAVGVACPAPVTAAVTADA